MKSTDSVSARAEEWRKEVVEKRQAERKPKAGAKAPAKAAPKKAKAKKGS
jgi:hypothetical protein